MLKKYSLLLLFVLLLIADLSYSFFLFYHVPVDGDLAGIAAPNVFYAEVLHDPLGLQVLLENKIYSAPNRFFAHWSLYTWFNHVPQYFHSFLNPVDSIFLACAVAKISMLITLVFTLASYITAGRAMAKNILLSALLVIPFFQIFGYNQTMGIIDNAITYAFFYALPMAILLLFFYPFYKSLYLEEKISWTWWKVLLWTALTFVLAFNGPLTPAVVLLVCPMILLKLWYTEFSSAEENSFIKRVWTSVGKIQPVTLLLLSFFAVLSLYSLYVGRNNSENGDGGIPIAERYVRLCIGFYEIITADIGWPLLLLLVFGNTVIMVRRKEPYSAKLLSILKWIGVFSFFYILLLPLGGYRDYRPNIIRYDTVIPVTLCLVYYAGITSFYLLNSLQYRFKLMYALPLILLLCWFVGIEEKWRYERSCQTAQINKIRESKEEIVEISGDCNLLSWGKIQNYKDSETAVTFLMNCGVLKERKYYFQK